MIQFGLAANILFPWQIAQGNNNRTAAALAGRPPTDGHFTKKCLCLGGSRHFLGRGAAPQVV
jgi:hypothetical protein